VTNFDETQCHKWAFLLQHRRARVDRALAAVKAGNNEEAKLLLNEVVYGVMKSEPTDPGMAGSLLYHMAMVTKMETETRFLLQQFPEASPCPEDLLLNFYDDFLSDAQKLCQGLLTNFVNPQGIVKEPLMTEDKIALYTRLVDKSAEARRALLGNTLNKAEILETLYHDWATQIVVMRLRQEYETIKGLLTTYALAKTKGIRELRRAMVRVQERFGKETVNIALEVTLKAGMRREKLQSIMLSDHYINFRMNIARLDASMKFLNCPIAGSHKHITQQLRLDENVAALFCKHFCYAHAKAMLETVLPFTFTLSQPQRMATHGKCEFYMKLANSPNAIVKRASYVPLVLSWNITRKCNLKCSHCYINASKEELRDELTTQEGKQLMDQISEVSRPLLILSGGEPLLRNDVYELAQYGTSKGFKMGLGSNGSLLDDAAARKLAAAGVKTVSISLDSSISEKHDEFRGIAGSWEKATAAIKALKKNQILVQVNTTVTQQNLNDIDNIMSLTERLGVENFHLFFLVPTGKGAKLTDISPTMYEHMIKSTFAKTANHKLNVRPSCAPQFMRIAKDLHLDMRQWIRGCLAGLYYCRVYPNGDVTPCPYLPIKLGNIRERTFREIWFNSPILKDLKDFEKLKGKCGICKYRSLCGGCRARAYGLSSDFIDFCGDLHEPAELRGDYLKEDPWCTYQPE
jgi:AdoMet-dependent heme synthase